MRGDFKIKLQGKYLKWTEKLTLQEKQYLAKQQIMPSAKFCK